MFVHRDLAEGIHHLDRTAGLAFQRFLQRRNLGRTTAQVNLGDGRVAGGCQVEIQRALEFSGYAVGDRGDNCFDLLRNHVTYDFADRSDFPRLGFLLANVQPLLNLFGERVTSDGDVAGECAGSASDDVDVRQSRADVDDGDGFLGHHGIVCLESVLDGEGGDIHDHRHQLRLTNDHAVVGDDFFLRGNQQKLHLPAGRIVADDLVVDLDVVLGKRNVVLGLPRDLLFQLLGGHRRDLDLLDDHRMARNRRCDLTTLDAQVVAEGANRLDHRTLVHDGAVDDGLRRQGFETEVDQL